MTNRFSSSPTDTAETAVIHINLICVHLWRFFFRDRSRRMMRSCLRLVAAIGGLAFTASFAFAQEKVNYQNNVLPIFRNICLNCHNPDKKKGGLDLSTFQA